MFCVSHWIPFSTSFIFYVSHCHWIPFSTLFHVLCFTLNTFQHYCSMFCVPHWIAFSTIVSCSVLHWIPFSTLSHTEYLSAHCYVLCFTLNTFQHTVSCCLFHTEYLSAHCFVFHTEYLSALLFHVLCWRSHDSPKAALQTDTQYLWGLKFYVLCYLCFVFHIKNEKHKHAITQFSEYNNLSYNINSSSTSLCVHHS